MEKKKKNWFKEHADTIVILGSFAICFWNLNEKLNDRFSSLDTRLTVIETVMVLKNIMPSELAKCDKNNE